jgi:hypothetical protein
MNYHEKLNPWCLVRLLPGMQHQVVARFRRRTDAEAHLQIMRRLIPDVNVTVVFYPALEQQEKISDISQL